MRQVWRKDMNPMYSSEVDGIEIDANEFIKVTATKLQNYINSDTTNHK